MEVEYKTRQRALILQFLSDNRERHLSVDEVFDYLRAQQSPVGKSTVYRCLDRLVSQGRGGREVFGGGARSIFSLSVFCLFCPPVWVCTPPPPPTAPPPPPHRPPPPHPLPSVLPSFQKVPKG